MPRAFAAAWLTSRTRSFTHGPRSFTRTTTLRPFSTFVTRRRVPNGIVRCAAVSLFMSKASPEAVASP